MTDIVNVSSFRDEWEQLIDEQIVISWKKHSNVAAIS